MVRFAHIAFDPPTSAEHIITDLSQTARGNASFRAFRLTSAFLDAYKKANFSTTRYDSIHLSFQLSIINPDA